MIINKYVCSLYEEIKVLIFNKYEQNTDEFIQNNENNSNKKEIINEVLKIKCFNYI